VLVLAVLHASKGWFEKFKYRSVLCSVKFKREATSVIHIAAKTCLVKFTELIQGNKPKLDEDWNFNSGNYLFTTDTK
jgi:hypothetical protein